MSVESEPEDVVPEGEEQWEEAYDEDDEDIDAEAEEIARKLWADISRDQPQSSHPPQDEQPNVLKTEEGDSHSLVEAPALQMISKVLALLSVDPEASNIVRAWIIPSESSSQHNVLDELRAINSHHKLAKSEAVSLGNAILSLVKSDALISRSSLGDKTSLSLDKRRRDEEPPGGSPQAKRLRLTSGGQELANKLGASVQQIQVALEKSSSGDSQPLDIPSIVNPLHQVYVFAVSASRTVFNPLGYEAGALQLQLQEVSGLVQVLGILGGTPFAENPSLGTSIFPCTSPSCGRNFQNYSALTNHTRATHSSASGEKIHQCNQCRQSFLRPHDLKRHLLTHAVTKHAFQCGGCQRVFSRRDAAKRHKDGARDKLNSGELKPDSDKARCAGGPILDVQQDLSGSMTDKFASGLEEDLDEGEIPRTLLSQLYGLVLGLAVPLRNCVSRAPGASATEGALQAQPQNTGGVDSSLEEAIQNVLALASQQSIRNGDPSMQPT